MTSPAGPAEIEVRAATINERFIAYVLDVLPFGAGFLATLWLAAYHPGVRAYVRDLKTAAWLWAALYVLYQFAGNLSGGTPGKKLLGIYVVRRKDGEKPGVAGAFLRAVGHLVSTPFFNFGFALALVQPESRALHDLLAGTFVVQPRARDKSVSALLFAAAILLLVGLWGTTLYTTVLLPTPGEVLAVQKARAGMLVMAQIEEAYKAQHQVYTDSLLELAKASGDERTFDAAVLALYAPNRFELKAGNAGYMIAAAARDRRRTRVAVAGPPARLLP